MSTDQPNQAQLIAKAIDTRNSTNHPFCHAAFNLIDRVANMDLLDGRAQQNSDDSCSQEAADDPPYLLTGLSLVCTHEPCLMCSMALLHSRIAEVFILRPSPGSGGMGSEYAVHEDRGLNHKFEVWKWKEEIPLPDSIFIPSVQVDP